ncbi:MAG: prenyltransferase [Hydrogenophilaceae bacterium]|nr:prenyltransferase [Hydrogenophilaceae bacterium]
MNTPSALPLEPTPERLRNPVLRYALATRPAFLTITLAGCLLGFATAWHGGVALNGWTAVATLLLGLLAHAGVNVLNDYYDHLNGTDENNDDRVFPFTGGSRFIQNGVLSPSHVLAYGLLLFALVIAGGLWLMAQSGQGLFWIGLAGLLIGWAYSAPPLKLNSRGWGELCVVAGFLLIVAGADFVQRGAFSGLPWRAGLPYALLTANILFINQFPDREADKQAGKHHWVVRLQPENAARVYGLIALGAAVMLVVLVVLNGLPVGSLVSLAGLLPVVPAWRTLTRHCSQPRELVPAIKATILAAHLHAVLLAASLFMGGWL